jgi:hypothetical protein
MGLDVKKTVDLMLEAMKPILGQHWDSVREYATAEADKIVRTLVLIESQKLVGAISEQQASILLDMQKNASQAVLAVLEGIGKDAVNQALSAGLAKIADPINKAVGFKLLR